MSDLRGFKVETSDSSCIFFEILVIVDITMKNNIYPLYTETSMKHGTKYHNCSLKNVDFLIIEYFMLLSKYVQSCSHKVEQCFYMLDLPFGMNT